MCAAAHAEQLHPAMVRSSLCVSVYMFSRLPGCQPALTVIAHACCVFLTGNVLQGDKIALWHLLAQPFYVAP